MRIKLADFCIRCGICEDLYPEIFRRNYQTHSIDVLYDEIPAELRERAKEAAKDCAIAAIHVAKD